MEQLDVLYGEVMELIAPFVQRYIYIMGDEVIKYDVTPTNVAAGFIGGLVCINLLIALIFYCLGRYLERRHLTVAGFVVKIISTIVNAVMICICLIGWILIHRQMPNQQVVGKIVARFLAD